MDIRRIVFTSILCAILLPCITGCGTKEEKAAKYLARGDRLMAKGDVTQAILEYKNSLQINPRNPSALLAMGKAFLAGQQYQKAFGAFNEALELDAGFDDARIEVATLLAPGQPQKTLEELDKISKPDSFSPKLEIAKARALLGLKKYGEAVGVLRTIKEGESNSDVQALLVICLRETGDSAGMEDALLKFRTLQPKDPFSYIVSAQYGSLKGDKQRAVREMEAMVRANPGDSPIALAVCKVYEQLGMLEEAETAFGQLSEEPDMIREHAAFLLRHDKQEKGKEILETLLAKNPGDVTSALTLVSIFVRSGEPAKALERVESTLKLELKDSEREKLLVAKASLKADANDRDASREICLDVLKRNEGSMDAHLLLGRLLLDSGKNEEAEIHLNQVAVARPNDVDAQVLLSRSQLLNKKESMASDTLNNAVRLNPASLELRLQFLRLLMAQKDFPQAINVIDKGLEIKPDNLALIKTRGDIRASQKEYAKAELDFRLLTKLSPDSSSGYLEMGRLMLAQSTPDKAIEWFKGALQKEKEWEMAIPGLMRCYQLKGDARAALPIVEAEIARKPASPVGNYFLGLAFLQTGDTPKAQKAFSKCIELAPGWLEPHRAMIQIYSQQGKIESAVAELKEAYLKAPSQAIGMSLAILYEQQKRSDEASRLYDELLEKSTNAPDVMNDLAYLFAEYRTESKDLEKAANLAAQALSKQPTNAAFMDTSAWVAYKQGNLSLAWSKVQDALNLQPEAGPVNLHAAVIADAMGDKNSAMERLDSALKENLDPASQKQAQDLKKKLEG